MKIAAITSLFVFLLSPFCIAADEPARPSLRSRLSEGAIKEAVRATLAERPENPRLHEADTLRGNRYDAFSSQVEEATVPDCLHADGLKRQPTFFLSGLLALPFIAVAKVRGKCQ